MDATVAGITVPTATGAATGTATCGATAGAGTPVAGSELGAFICGGGAGTAGGGTAGAVAVVGTGAVVCGRGGPTMKTSAFVGGLPGGIWSVTCLSCGSGVGVFRLTSPA